MCAHDYFFDMWQFDSSQTSMLKETPTFVSQCDKLTKKWHDFFRTFYWERKNHGSDGLRAVCGFGGWLVRWGDAAGT